MFGLMLKAQTSFQVKKSRIFKMLKGHISSLNLALCLLLGILMKMKKRSHTEEKNRGNFDKTSPIIASVPLI